MSQRELQRIKGQYPATQTSAAGLAAKVPARGK